MKHKKAMTTVAFLLLGLGGLNAQETVPTTGGEATGSGGSSNYTVGQVVYTTNSGSNGSVAQGVQQPYEISITSGINETAINLEMSIYPNPTANILQLSVETEKLQGVSYQLYDLQGKIIETKKVSVSNTTINMEGLSRATYFLKVSNNSKIVKTFKVIKS